MKKTIIVLSLLALSGCATILGDKTQLIGIKSTPSEASINITDEKGVSIYKGNTPTSVTLQKSDGSYFGGKTYQVSIEKPGYKTTRITLDTKVNAWYVAGNLVFGGLIGWLVVDPLSGAMYTIKPEDVSAQLAAQGTTGMSNEKGFHIVLLEDVPSPIRHHLNRIN